MRSLFKLMLVLTSLSTFVACSNKQADQQKGVVRLNSSEIMADQTLTPQEKAEKLALAGEQLATPTGFMYADLVLNQALSLDANNKRAQLYKAYLATPMALKGILARIKPLAYKDEKSKKDYNDEVAHLPNSGLKTFLLSGKADIKTEKDMQSFADSIYKAQDQFRTFLKNNKNLEITLNVNDWAGIGSINQAIQDCGVSQDNTDGSYILQKCDLTHALEVKLNRADIESLQQIAAGVQIYLAMFTAYDASGSISVTEKYKNQENVSTKTLYKELSKNPDFLKLRNSNALKGIVGMGVDAVAGVRYAVQIQNELCASGTENTTIDENGKENPPNRKGFLFSQGICINAVNDDGTKLEDTLKTVDAVLAGQSIEAKLGQNKEIDTKVRPIAPLENPIADLKSLRPVFDDCDNIYSVSDDTLGGFFPKHDANNVLYSEAKGSCQQSPSINYN